MVTHYIRSTMVTGRKCVGGRAGGQGSSSNSGRDVSTPLGGSLNCAFTCCLPSLIERNNRHRGFLKASSLALARGARNRAISLYMGGAHWPQTHPPASLPLCLPVYILSAETAEVAQRFKVCAAPAEALSSVLIITSNSSSKGIRTLWPPWAPFLTCVYIHTRTNKHINNNNKTIDLCKMGCGNQNFPTPLSLLPLSHRVLHRW